MLPYDMNAFKREFIKKKTPEKELTLETSPIQILTTPTPTEKVACEQGRSELLTTLTSSTADPSSAIPALNGDSMPIKALLHEPKTKMPKVYRTEREKSKPIFEKKEKIERKFFIIKPDCES